MSAPRITFAQPASTPQVHKVELRSISFPKGHPAFHCYFHAYELVGHPTCLIHGSRCEHLAEVQAWIASLGTDEWGDVRWPS